MAGRRGGRVRPVVIIVVIIIIVVIVATIAVVVQQAPGEASGATVGSGRDGARAAICREGAVPVGQAVKQAAFWHGCCSVNANRSSLLSG